MGDLSGCPRHHPVPGRPGEAVVRQFGLEAIHLRLAVGHGVEVEGGGGREGEDGGGDSHVGGRGDRAGVGQDDVGLEQLGENLIYKK